MCLVAPNIPQAGPVMAVAKLWNLFGAVMTLHHQNMLRISLVYVQLC